MLDALAHTVEIEVGEIEIGGEPRPRTRMVDGNPSADTHALQRQVHLLDGSAALLAVDPALERHRPDRTTFTHQRFAEPAHGVTRRGCRDVDRAGKDRAFGERHRALIAYMTMAVLKAHHDPFEAARPAFRGHIGADLEFHGLTAVGEAAACLQQVLAGSLGDPQLNLIGLHERPRAQVTIAHDAVSDANARHLQGASVAGEVGSWRRFLAQRLWCRSGVVANDGGAAILAQRRHRETAGRFVGTHLRHAHAPRRPVVLIRPLPLPPPVRVDHEIELRASHDDALGLDPPPEQPREPRLDLDRFGPEHRRAILTGGRHHHIAKLDRGRRLQAQRRRAVDLEEIAGARLELGDQPLARDVDRRRDEQERRRSHNQEQDRDAGVGQEREDPPPAWRRATGGTAWRSRRRWRRRPV